MLSETHPHVAAQWHPTRNTFPLEKATSGMERKVWWVCDECSYEWEATIKQRCKGSGCPVCAKTNRYLKPVANSLTEAHPELLKLWHPTKNGAVKPEYITRTSSRVIWWQCGKGHEWSRSAADMTRRTSECPYCTNKKVLPGFNDFATAHPQLAEQWHPTKNDVNPTQVLPGSHYQAWWLGECGHEWETSVQNRVHKNTKCPYCAGRKVLPGFNDLATTHPDLSLQVSIESSPSSKEVVAGSKSKLVWECPECSHLWVASAESRTRSLSNCPSCSAEKKYFVSKPQQELQAYIESLQLETSRSNRSVLKNIKHNEIDIYIPEKKIGIEFNGLYWHSETAGKHRTYHHDKWAAAKQAGVQLIQVWEDDWNRNPELIKRMLAHKLGVSEERTVYARRTKIMSLTTSEAQQFLNSYHIQGYASASYYLGLRDIETDETVAVLTLKKEAGTEGRTLNIIRYATSANVVGGFTKLLTYAERTYKPESFITFADHCVSDGGLYENNGFIADKELDPDYMYVVKGERRHKFGYRLKKFRDDPNLKYEEGLTERELALLNNLPRIWDAGKTRYVKTVS